MKLITYASLILLIVVLLSVNAFGQSTGVDLLTIGGDLQYNNFNQAYMRVGSLKPTASGTADTTISTGPAVIDQETVTYEMVWQFELVGLLSSSSATGTLLLNVTIGNQTLSQTYQVGNGQPSSQVFWLRNIILAPNTTTSFHADLALSCSTFDPIQVTFLCNQVGLLRTFVACSAQSGTIMASPTSGLAGSSVAVTGANWTTTSGSYYQLLFDNNLVAQQSPLTSCIEQPNLLFAIPCGTSLGTHTIQCQLVDSTTQLVLRSTVATFEVVNSFSPCQVPIKIKSITFETLNGQPLTDNNPIIGNEVKVNGQQYGGGLRVFPDADVAGGLPNREVVVKVKLTSARPGTVVYLRSFDVEDSSGIFNLGASGQDNIGPLIRPDGIPREGEFEGFNLQPVATAITGQNSNAADTATIKFKSTMQPGDNFRVVASTDQIIISNLYVDGQQIIDPLTGLQPLAEESSVSGADAIMSKMLTVWRKLHIEIDSMPDPVSASDPNADTDPERNFIKGEVIDLTNNGNKIRLSPMPTTPLIKLDDGSPNLSSAMKSNGRFQDGTIQVGPSTTSVSGNGVDKDGIEFVELKNAIELPFNLTKSGSPAITGFIKETNRQKKEITLTKSLGSNANSYEAGTITIAGIDFTIVKIKGPTLEVLQEPKFPFVLFDDDQAKTPFLESASSNNTNLSGTAFELVQPSNQASENLFAPAYIMPVYDLGSGTKVPIFDRNLGNLQDRSEIDNIRMFQDNPSTDNFWVVYIQGAFQGRIRSDADPNLNNNVKTEGSQLGVTQGEESSISPVLINLGPSALFSETILDFERQRKISSGLCLKQSFAHEIGHQFGLRDNIGGLMDQGCPKPQPSLLSDHIKLIRQRIHPQDSATN